MQNKRNRLMYSVLGLMLFSLIIFSGLPLIGIVITEKVNEPATSDLIPAMATSEMEKLEAEAKGYQKVLNREPNNETALRHLLDIRLQQQNIDRAILPLTKLSQLHPEQTEYSILLGQTKQYTKDYEGAASAYRQALAIEPGDIKALSELAHLFLKQDRPQKAISLLENSIKQAEMEDSEDNANSIKLLLAEIYVEREEIDSAINIYDRISEVAPEDFRPVLAKGLLLQKQGQKTEAESLLEQAKSLAPNEFKDLVDRISDDR